MRNLKDLLSEKRTNTGKVFSVDEKTLFFILKKVVKELYGTKGVESIIPITYKEKKLFLQPRSSLWANEITLEKKKLIQRVNELLEGEAVEDIRLTQRSQ